MKTLYLVRHAKASHGDPSLPDRDRPLDHHGEKDAPKMGRQLARQGVKPDLIVSSPARRALTTALHFADELGHRHADIVVDERLYASDPASLLAVIGEFDHRLDSVMLFGHNPEFTELAQHWSRDIADLPTCAVVALRFDTGRWPGLGRLEPESVTLDHPKS